MSSQGIQLRGCSGGRGAVLTALSSAGHWGWSPGLERGSALSWAELWAELWAGLSFELSRVKLSYPREWICPVSAPTCRAGGWFNKDKIPFIEPRNSWDKVPNLHSALLRFLQGVEPNCDFGAGRAAGTLLEIPIPGTAQRWDFLGRGSSGCGDLPEVTSRVGTALWAGQGH